jgi:hypothetical protein
MASPPTGRVVRVVQLDTAGDREVAALIDAVPAADMVVMVATAGVDPPAVSRIGLACSDARVVTTTLVIRGPDATDAMLARTLARVRPWSLMVVVAGDPSYLDDILRSFR